MINTPLGEFRRITNDPFAPFFDAWQFKCPGCGQWAYMDNDQWHGRVSTMCDCGYHETHSYKQVLLDTIQNGDKAEYL